MAIAQILKRVPHIGLPRIFGSHDSNEDSVRETRVSRQVEGIGRRGLSRKGVAILVAAILLILTISLIGNALGNVLYGVGIMASIVLLGAAIRFRVWEFRPLGITCIECVKEGRPVKLYFVSTRLGRRAEFQPLQRFGKDWTDWAESATLLPVLAMFVLVVLLVDILHQWRQAPLIIAILEAFFLSTLPMINQFDRDTTQVEKLLYAAALPVSIVLEIILMVATMSPFFKLVSSDLDIVSLFMMSYRGIGPAIMAVMILLYHWVYTPLSSRVQIGSQVRSTVLRPVAKTRREHRADSEGDSEVTGRTGQVPPRSPFGGGNAADDEDDEDNLEEDYEDEEVEQP